MYKKVVKVGIAQRFWKDKLVFTTFLNFNSGHRINHKHTGCGQKMWTRVFLLLIGKIYLITLHSQIATVREPWYHYQGPKKMYLSCIQGLPPLRNHQTMSVRQGRKGCRIQIGENKPSIIIIIIFYSNQTTIIVLYYVEYRTEQICLLCLQVKTIMHVWWRHVVLLWSHQRQC